MTVILAVSFAIFVGCVGGQKHSCHWSGFCKDTNPVDEVKLGAVWGLDLSLTSGRNKMSTWSFIFFLVS